MSLSVLKISGADIERLVNRIESAIEHEDINHATIACLVVAIMAQKPEVEPDELQTAVRGVSEYLAATLNSDEVTH